MKAIVAAYLCTLLGLLVAGFSCGAGRSADDRALAGCCLDAVLWLTLIRPLELLGRYVLNVAKPIESEIPMTEQPTEKLCIDLDALQVEPEEAYNAQRANFLGSHALNDFIRCPQLYHKKTLGIIEDRDSADFLVGRAAHVRILQGLEAYEAQFAIGGPVNPTTGKPYGEKTKAFAEWAAVQGKPVLSPEQHTMVENLFFGVSSNDKACDLLLHGRAEGVARGEYGGVACQIRIDWLNPLRGIVDLKTTRNLDEFEDQFDEYGYAIQGAFYQVVLAQAVGQLVPVHFIAVEKREPFRCGVWQVGEATLAAARGAIMDALNELKWCRQSGYWPTRYESVRTL